MFSAVAPLLALAAHAADSAGAPEAPALRPSEGAALAAATPAEIQRWLDSVVLLVTGPAWCTGVIIDDQGTVATAYHCVASGRRPRVDLRDGRSYVGKAVAAWPREDLALVSVPDLARDPRPPPALKVRAAPPVVGERVYGLGHPLAPVVDRSPLLEGTLRWSVTEGVVSNAGSHFLQTDAALNPGNSGGPVVDAQGQVLGIVSRKLKGDNLAFAVTNTRLNQLVAEREDRPLSPLGGTLAVTVGLATPSAAYGSLTGIVRVEADFRDRVILSGAAGLPYAARDAAETWGSSQYPWADLSLGGRARFGRGTWSTALEAGGTVVAMGGYTWDEALQVALTDDPVPLPGGYARVELAGVGLRVAALVEQGSPLMVLTVELDAPGALITF